MVPDLSIVVLSWNTTDLLQACLRSLQADASPLAREIIVVDNASADGSADMVAARFPAVRLIRNDANLLYSEGNNIGARAATGRHLCLLNSDTEVSPGALDQLVQYLRQHPDCGLVGPRLVNPDGSVQRGCRRFPTMAEAFWAWGWLRRTRAGQRAEAHSRMADFDHLTSRDVEQPLGACMMVEREEFLRLGGLDQVLSLFYNDVDLCLRLARGGRRVHYLASAVVMHHHGASTKKRVEEFGSPLWNANRIAFYRKQHGWFAALAVRLMLSMSLVCMFFRILLGRRTWAEKREVLGRFRVFARRSLGGSGRGGPVSLAGGSTGVTGQRYLIVLPVPFRPLGDGRNAVESAFAEHLRKLRESLRPRVDRLEVMAPVMDEGWYEAARPSMAELQTDVDGVEFTAAYRLPRMTALHLLTLPALAVRLWSAVGRSAFVHGGPATLLQPFQNLALLFGWMRGRTTVFVNDIDHRESPRMGLQTGLYSYGAYWRAQYLQRPWFDLQLRLAGRLCSTLLLKGRALVDDYGRGRPHVHYLLDCAHAAEFVLDDERMLAKHRRIADLGRPLRACYFGRLVAYKGVDRMVDAVAQARRNGAEVTFDIFGFGDREPALREQVQRLQLQGAVNFHGPKPYGSKLFAELEPFDLMLAAMLAQDTPRSAIDAQAAGMGVLAFDTYYYRELQELGSGVELVPWPDVAAMASALGRLAADRDRVVAMSRRAVEFARRNSQEDWLRRRAGWTFGTAPESGSASTGSRSQRT